VWYCSKECQRKFSPIHQFECKNLRIFACCKASKTASAAVKINISFCLNALARKSWEEQKDNLSGIEEKGRKEIPEDLPNLINSEDLEDDGVRFAHIMSLVSNSDIIKKNEPTFWVEYEESAKLLKNILSFKNSSKQEIDAVQLLCIAQCNCFGIREDHELYGVFLNGKASLVNHSCVPNTSVFFEGNYLRMKSTCEVPSGTELFHSYLEVNFESRRFRQERLLKYYYFWCKCNRCLEDEKTEIKPVETSIIKNEGRQNPDSSDSENDISLIVYEDL